MPASLRNVSAPDRRVKFSDEQHRLFAVPWPMNKGPGEIAVYWHDIQTPRQDSDSFYLKKQRRIFNATDERESISCHTRAHELSI